MKRSSYSCPGDWTGNHLKASSWTKIKTADLMLQRNSISNYGTFLLSSANLSSYLLSPLFQEPGSTLRTWGTGLAAQTQFLCKPARPCISPQTPAPGSGWALRFEGRDLRWPPLLAKQYCSSLSPTLSSHYILGLKHGGQFIQEKWMLGEENLSFLLHSQFFGQWIIKMMWDSLMR